VNPASQFGLSTRCVHAGDVRDSQGALHAPLYNHSTFGFAQTRDVLDVVEGRRDGSLYTRYGDEPNLRDLPGDLLQHDLPGWHQLRQRRQYLRRSRLLADQTWDRDWHRAARSSNGS
jgi:hypothetical protein